MNEEEMRRKDREMGQDFALRVIDDSAYGVLSVVDSNGYPYAMPLSIVRKGNSLYFHSAKAGKKVEAFTTTDKVCIVFVGEIKIPELYSEEELKSFLDDETKGVTLSSRVFTTEYESAMVFGRIHLVEDEEEETEALRMICEKYTPSKMDYFHLAVRSGLSKTNIYRIEMDEITAKRKKYDSSGEEMKWGRVE